MTLKQLLSRHVKTDEESIALVEQYVKRELIRPKTRWGVPLLVGLLMLLAPLGVGFVILRIFPHFDALPCYLISYFTVGLPLLRLLLIKVVECYQHYAKEELRRFCMCMPSCSEYAIKVLKRYPLAVALFKIVFRLTVTCDGEMKIDLP